MRKHAQKTGKVEKEALGIVRLTCEICSAGFKFSGVHILHSCTIDICGLHIKQIVLFQHVINVAHLEGADTVILEIDSPWDVYAEVFRLE